MISSSFPLSLTCLWIFIILSTIDYELVQSFQPSRIVLHPKTRGVDIDIPSKYTGIHRATSSPLLKHDVILLGNTHNKRLPLNLLRAKSNDDNALDQKEEDIVKQRKRDKVMSFLRKVGAVGKNKDFSTALGVDEGPVGKTNDPIKV